jgi:hypothetical protein
MKYDRLVNVVIEVTNEGNCGVDCQMAACDGREEGICTLFGHNIDRENRHPDCIKLCEGQEPKFDCTEFLKQINMKCPEFEKLYDSNFKFSLCGWKAEFVEWIKKDVRNISPTKSTDCLPAIGVRYGIPLPPKTRSLKKK